MKKAIQSVVCIRLKLTAIDTIFSDSDHYVKRKIVGSIYPDKFTFEDLNVRTAKRSEVFEFIYLINNKLNSNKNGTNDIYSRLSQEVIPSGFEPETDRLEICCSIQLSYGTICAIFAVQICKFSLKI